MQTKTLYILFLILLASGYGCKEEFIPDTKNTEETLVVDGMITNEPGPYTIRISKSIDLKDTTVEFSPYRHCEVIIDEEHGEREQLREVSPGIYKTKHGGIQGKVGHSYKIHITTSDGKVYETQYQEMNVPIGIDTIYPEKEIKRTAGELSPDIPGYRFFVDTKMSFRENTYFMWKLKETYEYTANYHVHAIFRNNQITEVFWGDSLYRCWNNKDIKDLYITNTSGLSQAKVLHHPLHFVGTDTKRLQVKYSLLVSQYTISRNAYEFWSKVREQMSEQFYLFSSQPYQIKGNLTNPDNPSDMALGYFMVASVDTKRIFVRSPNFPFYYNRCMPDPNIDNLYGNVPPNETIYLTYMNPMMKTTLGMVQRSCVDCTMDGGTMNKPDFW